MTPLIDRNPVIHRDLAQIIAHNLPWGDFAGKTVLISGANGFLPAYMVETLLYLNETRGMNCGVIGLVRNRERADKRFAHLLNRRDFSLLVQDVCSPIALQQNADFIIHAASEASPKYYIQDPAGTLLANTLGTYNLLELARKSRSRGFLFFSSGEVYGLVTQPLIKENNYGSLDPTDVRSCYGEGKRMGEAMCAAWHREHGVPAKIVRISHTYGPGMSLDDGRVFADFVGNIVRNEDIALKSDGSARPPFCYLADATVGFFTVLLCGEAGEPYNLANTDAEVSMLELAETLVRIFPERKLAVKFAEGVAPAEPTRATVKGPVPDTTKLRKLGWRPTTSIEEGFNRTVTSFEGVTGVGCMRSEMNAKHTNRNCPICGSDRKKTLFEQRFSTVLLVQGYNVVVCKDCGFGFADQIPEQEAFDAYYRDLSKFEYEHRDGKESQSDEMRLLDVAGLLSKLIPDRDARILDLGCSTGRLLAALRDNGFANVWGLDPSPGCAEAARKLYNVPVFTNTFSGFRQSDEKFDFVIMIGVLEHIRDLNGVLSVLKNIIRPNGRVYIDVPDATQFADWPDAPFQEFSTEHINFFSGRSLTNLMQMQCFKCTFSQKAQRSYTETTVMPSVEAVFEKAGVKTVWERDDQTEARLGEYIRQSREVDDSVKGVLEKTASIQQPIIVWGIGTHTQRLLAAGALDKLNICLFVDSNPKYHGEKLRGIPVVSPNELKSRTDPILICSRVFQLEIERQAREELNLKNQLVLLYDLRDAPSVGT